MREESARGTRLHVTSAGGKRVSGQRRFSTLLSYFLSELSGKHDLVFTMIFFLSSTTADPTPPTSPAHSAANCTHIQVRSGDAVGPESRAAHPSTLSSRSSDVCNRTNHRRNTHRKVISQKPSCPLLTFSLLTPGLSVTMSRSGLDRGNPNTRDSSPN